MLHADHAHNLCEFTFRDSISVYQWLSADHLTLLPVHGDFLNQEQLDLDHKGYPELPSSMLGGVSLLLNLLTFYSNPVPLTTILQCIFLQLAWFWLILLKRLLATYMVKVSGENLVKELLLT